jgi:succinate dehydrogenase / fumarate reductase membrane anchor subunit
MTKQNPTMRTSLSQVRHLGSARSGTTDMWRMRVTSIALLPLAVGFVALMISLVGSDYVGVRTLIGKPVPALLMLLFIGAGIVHMQIGMKVIIEDYIHGAHTKEWALMANLFFCVSVGLACVYAVLKLSFI